MLRHILVHWLSNWFPCHVLLLTSCLLPYRQFTALRSMCKRRLYAQDDHKYKRNSHIYIGPVCTYIFGNDVMPVTICLCVISNVNLALIRKLLRNNLDVGLMTSLRSWLPRSNWPSLLCREVKACTVLVTWYHDKFSLSEILLYKYECNCASVLISEIFYCGRFDNCKVCQLSG